MRILSWLEMSHRGSWPLEGYITDCQKPSLWILWLTSDNSKTTFNHLLFFFGVVDPCWLFASNIVIRQVYSLGWVGSWCCWLLEGSSLFWWRVGSSSDHLLSKCHILSKPERLITCLLLRCRLFPNMEFLL